MAEHEPSARPFMDLRVPEYAYMFGFLQADGHLSQQSRDRGRLTVEINARDIEILHEFQRLTPYNSTISGRTRSTNFAESSITAVWSMWSLEARTTINQLGLPYGRKSKKITPPRVEFSRRDYLRGLVDADGSIGYTGQQLPFISLTTASTAVGIYFCRYARMLMGAERLIKRNARDGIYNINYDKEQAARLAADLYYPGCLSLERKQTKADSLAAWVRPADMKVSPKRRWRLWEDEILLGCDNPASAAETLGRTIQSCNLRLWRLRTGQVPMPSSN
ncbi:hypothetical protein [Streptomyces sp. NPDC059009]|uniref:hypothetical protein n=1 Tax=Streptomyces sp. NPDC059009 TaxID=3346694 RepID=UPI00368169A4